MSGRKKAINSGKIRGLDLMYHATPASHYGSHFLRHTYTTLLSIGNLTDDSEIAKFLKGIVEDR
jgi:hypothetical protein